MATKKTPNSRLGVTRQDSDQTLSRQQLTKLERQARRESRQSIRVANYGGSAMGGFSGYGSSPSNVTDAHQQFYSPQLSTDFLELPQSEREKRELFRFWYTCFVPGTPVLLSDGTTAPIETVVVGTKLPNGLGEPTEVVETFRCDIKDNIVKMTLRGVQGDVLSTGNHPYYVLRADSVDCKYTDSSGACKQGANAICRRLKCESVGPLSPEFVYAKDLRVGDHVLSPWMKDSRDCGLSREKLRLLGYFASEGSLAYRSAGVVRGVEFSLNIDEAETIAVEIQDLYMASYGKRARVYKYPSRNTSKVVCDGLDFARFCEEFVGLGSHNKVLHESLVHALPGQILEFLGAYWNGDGCFTDNSYTADSMSGKMASQVFQMLRRLQIPAYHSSYFRPVRHIGDRDFPAGTVHYVSFPGRYQGFFRPYANHVDGDYSVSSTRVYLTSCEYGFLHRIESLEAVPYDGPVYNFEVRGEGDRKSYIAHGLATHNTHPIVGAAIDFHTDVPMSKIRLSLPKGKDRRRNKQILHFYEEMCRRVRMFQVLYDATHEYWLQGNVFIFAEDQDMLPEVPEELTMNVSEEEVGDVDWAGRSSRRRVKKLEPKPPEEQHKAILDFVAKNYRGWEKLTILPPEQVKLEVFQYTNKTKMELIPSEKDRLVVLRAQNTSDPEAAKIAADIPDMIKDRLLNGQPIPLNTSPYQDYYCSSFCYHLAHKKAAYDDRGTSILERCLRTLLFQDKLRQAQTSIASRAMTPKRVVWGDKMSETDVEGIRDQIDQALQDPDFTVVANFELHWDEIGSRDRLLDLSTEYEITNKLLFIGLRITESMLTGETTYSGERIHLDVMNTMYLLYRETMAQFVEEQLFAPVAEKKQFFEIDEDGNRNLLYPKLQFTRLALRDNTELQDFMYNLYQKGSMPIAYIYDLLNIDVDDAHDQLQKDAFTLKDSNMNELIRAALTSIGDSLAEDTDVKEKVHKNLGLKAVGKGGDRFGKSAGGDE